jgi:hypothetical protein
LQQLLASTTKLAIDEGFSVESAANKSLIGAEYLEKLVPGTLPSQVLIALANTGRVTTFKSSLQPQLAKKLNQLVANKRDRTFVKVCVNSVGKVLVSHDYEDFPVSKRGTISRSFGISIVDALSCQRLL